MKKNYILIAIVFGATSLNAQVGINTELPKSTLHVKESEEFKSTLPEGIITPQFSGNDLKAKDNLYTELQKGTIVYITEGLTEAASDKTININNPGYYFFDGAVWQKMNIEPWRIQNTNKQASNNYENIYQEGNVAIGFKENDPTSKYKLDVKGATKTEVNSENENYVKINGDKGRVPYLGNFNYNFESYYSGDIIDFTNSENVFNNSLINGRLSTRNTLYYPTNNNSLKLIGREERYDNKTNSDLHSNVQSIHLLNGNSASFTVSTDSDKYLHNGIVMQSNPDASNLKSVFTLNSRQDFENQNTISLSDPKGIVFQYSKPDEVSGIRTSGAYIFPKSIGSENQVLTTKGYDNSNPPRDADGNPLIRTELEWKNISDLTSPQPWKVQGTETQASDNNQNIYQEGKVAIGFDKDGPVSNYNLHVKGTSNVVNNTSSLNSFDVKGLAVDYGSSNEIIVDVKSMYSGEAIDITNPENILSIDSKTNNRKGYYEVIGSANSTDTNQTLKQEIFFDKSNPDLKINVNKSTGFVGKSAINQIFINSGNNHSNSIIMQSDSEDVGLNGFVLESKVNGNVNKISLENSTGIKFSFSDNNDTENKSSYVFPRKAGTLNQVLVSKTQDETNTTHLEWKNISDLISPQTEPWKIQGTDTQASDNNQNIYQEGKVAIGHKLTDRVADTSLEVNGAISTIKTTNINNQKFTNSKLISQEFNNGNESVFIDGNFGYLGEPFDFTSSVSNFRNSVEDIILSPKGFMDYKVTGLTDNRLVSLNEVRIYDKTNSNQKIIFENDYGINLSNSNYRVATGVGEYSTGLKMISDVNNSGEFSNQFILGSYNISNKNEIKLGTTEENVTFKFSRKISDDMYREESYVFPSNNGEKNQVLVTDGGSSNTINSNAKLEWKNMGEIVEEVVLNKIKIKSPGNKCFEITVSDNGQLNTEEVTCPQ
ncbi:hypothetical protein [Faecalibacter bovis]|uniref:Uncharacterized protein n=1 Tax=Faecalibacter bovis TaxID=2898187 RepID=A0ABX7XAR2_9FLAO|nr:hypothetical protein [Faecalibacter bovis]QTV04869.1 hypothetical protein J9309_08665 [Faecalibacter bovis]